MNETLQLPHEVAEYLGAVRAALADLPAEERDELLADVEGSLLDAANESGEPIAARLGPPERFAGELRAAAGLEPAPAATPAKPERGAFVRLADAVRQTADDPRFARARSTARELAPVWWAVRGYVAVALLAFWLLDGFANNRPWVPWFGSGEFSLLILAGGIAGSLAIGLRARNSGPRSRRLRRAGLAANIVLALSTWPISLMVLDGDSTSYQAVYEEPIEVHAPAGLSVDGRSVTNIYPYSRDGKLLLDVLLYDDAGKPLEVKGERSGDPDRRWLFDRRGEPVQNAFPIRYLEPGTERVADPKAGPEVTPPEIATPPLEEATAKKSKKR